MKLAIHIIFFLLTMMLSKETSIFNLCCHFLLFQCNLWLIFMLLMYPLFFSFSMSTVPTAKLSICVLINALDNCVRNLSGGKHWLRLILTVDYKFSSDETFKVWLMHVHQFWTFLVYCWTVSFVWNENAWNAIQCRWCRTVKYAIEARGA